MNSSCTPRAALRFEAGDTPASAAPWREENLASKMHSSPARLGLQLGLRLGASPLRRVPALTGKPCLNTRGSRQEGGGSSPRKALPPPPHLPPAGPRPSVGKGPWCPGIRTGAERVLTTCILLHSSVGLLQGVRGGGALRCRGAKGAEVSHAHRTSLSPTMPTR